MYEWALIEDRIKFMATDADGECHGFSSLPWIDGDMWVCEKGTFWINIPQPEHVDMDSITKNWKESLEKKPDITRIFGSNIKKYEGREINKNFYSVLTIEK